MSAENMLTRVTDSYAWNAWLAGHGGHVLQTSAWGDLKSSFGWRAERLWWCDGEEVRAAAQILFRSLAPGLTLAYVPRGPCILGPTYSKRFLALVADHMLAQGVFMLKLEPNWLRGDARETGLLRAGLIPSAESIQPPATVHIDLSAETDTLLARMKPKWRYNIRLAEKKGVEVRAGALSDLPVFHDLMLLTGKRDHFAIHSADYYRAALEQFEKQDSARLFIAEYKGTALAAIFVTAFAGEAIYLYGASGNVERNRMPNHALHWHAMLWAKARGCTRYDLWGIPEPETGGAYSLPSSLYQFKLGFGGEVVRYTGAWDQIYSRARHQLYKLARRVRKRALT